MTAVAPPRRAARRRRSRRRGWLRARSVIGTVVLVAVSAFALITVVLPMLLGAHTYTVLTGSMQPGMPPGTLVAVRPAPIDDVRIGDVVTYQVRSGESTVVTHRVVGSTSSTGGERLLITRGDANNAEDPPVQEEQLRGRVVLAVPVLGYPGVLFGGQERGALIAAVGVAVVGYGIALLVVDAMRTRGRRRALIMLAVVVGAASLVPVWGATPAQAAEPGRPPASEHLRLSADGRTFVSDGSIRLFPDADGLVPGGRTESALWVRNDSPDPARAYLRIEVGTPADAAGAAFERSLALLVGDDAVASGEEWRSEVIAPGDTVRLDVALRMDAAAGNDTRAAGVEVTPWVRLVDARGADSSASTGQLPRTGVDGSVVVGVAVAGAALVGIGALARRRRPSQGSG